MPIDALSVLCAQLTRDLLAIAKFLFHRRVSCFNGLPESVVSSKTVAEFKPRLSEVDLSSFLRYNFNNSTGCNLYVSGYANNPAYTIYHILVCYCS